jgi:curli biogenesis system outer membrane secretion channel CsgG
MRTRHLLFIAAAGLAGCATPKVAFNARADFSAIERVAVMTFSGPEGDLAADLLTQNLLAHGANVVERQQLEAVLREQRLSTSGMLDPRTIKQLGKLLGVDALFVGTVARSMPSQSYVVTSSRRNIVTTITPVAGPNVSSRGSVFGVPDSQIVTTAATASIVSRLIEVETGSVLWSASMSYEGFDIQSAMDSILDGFAHSLTPVWPALGPAKKAGSGR